MTAIPIVNYRQRASLAVNSIFGFLVVLSIILRIVARKIVHRPLDASDYCACVGAAAATGMTIISVLAVSRGGLAYGTPPEIAMAFGPGTLEDLFKLMIPAQCLWVTSLTFSKLSVLLLYLNLFSHRSMVWISKGLMVFIAMWGLTSLIVGFAFCDPFEAQWKTVPGGTCLDRAIFYWTSGSISLTTDLLVVVLPLKTISKLQMARYKKIVLMCAFSLGFVGCAFSAMRLGLINGDFSDTKVGLYLTNILSTLEGALACILCCIPMLRPLFGKERPTRAGYSDYSSGSGGPQKSGDLNNNRATWRRTGPQLSGVDSDRIQLRSIGEGKSRAEVSSAPAVDRTMAAYGMANDDLVSVKSDDDVQGIIVKQEWQVTSHHASSSRRPSVV